MSIVKDIAVSESDLVAWRRQLHAHPELAFEEHWTSEFVVEQLKSFGIMVDRGLAGTGVVGTLKSGSCNRAIGLRADMDALPIQERRPLPYRSTTDGKMHACGHDGHMAMLLGAARYLAETRRFNGTVYFIFQPGEELGGGGRVMVEQGLFERFPADAVFAMHNVPGIPVGKFAIRHGPAMAAAAIFDIVVNGKGAHAAYPERSIDPIVVASHLILAAQSIVARNISPHDQAVLSITQVNGGTAYNIIPSCVTIRGCARTFSLEVLGAVETALRRVARDISRGFGAESEVSFNLLYPPLVNHTAQTNLAADADVDVVGEDNVDRAAKPRMGSEDFSFMLQAKPGAFIFIGNGEAINGSELHSPDYDFNDEILTAGASYFARLVERNLPLA